MKLRCDMDLGRSIQKLRKQRNMTQSEVSAQLQLLGLDYSRSFYSRFETGERNIPVSVIVGLTKIFDCDYNAIFENIKSTD